MSGVDERRRQALAVNEAAAERWAHAMRAHALAPPDPGFPGRLRELADAARARARGARLGDSAGLRWRARPGALRSQPPYELRPDTGRTGPPELWEVFDGAVAAYNAAMAGTDGRAVGDAADALADAAEAIASALERELAQPRTDGRRQRQLAR